jgi:hypothetical protein
MILTFSTVNSLTPGIISSRTKGWRHWTDEFGRKSLASASFSPILGEGEATGVKP